MRGLWFILISMTLTAGCQTAPSPVCLDACSLPLSHRVPPVDVSQPFPQTPIGHSVIQASAIESVEPEELMAAPALDLSLSDALALALERNPDWLTTLQNRPISRAALEVAKRYPYAPTAQRA